MENKKIVVLGKTTEQIFEMAGKALFKEMINVEEVEPKKSAKFSVKGKNLDELLKNYLEELISLSETKKMIYCQFRAKIKESVEGSGEKFLVLEGVVFGEKPKKVFDKVKKISEAKVVPTGAEFIIE